MLTRRDLFRAAPAAALLGCAPRLFAEATPAPAAEDPKAAAGFKLSKLPYGYDALEPFIDTTTMTIHHTKHQQAYVDALNNFLKGGAPELLAQPIETVLAKANTLPETIKQAVRNNAGGHWNHDFFWKLMAKPGAAAGEGGGTPKGDLLAAIEKSVVGGFEAFKKGIAGAATSRFGSGWVWVVPGKEKPLDIIHTANQDNPLLDGGRKPILGLDVWEHAYYLKYQNQRAKYVEAWFNVVNWDAVAANYADKDKA